jgi:hypothetical protein
VKQSILRWIDAGYFPVLSRSNNVMGLLMSFFGLVALSVDNPLVRAFFFALAILTFVFFGWRMIVSIRRLAIEEDRRKATDG